MEHGHYDAENGFANSLKIELDQSAFSDLWALILTCIIINEDLLHTGEVLDRTVVGFLGAKKLNLM